MLDVVEFAGGGGMAGSDAKTDGPPMTKTRREILHQKVWGLSLWTALCVDVCE